QLAQQQETAVRCDPPAVERALDTAPSGRLKIEPGADTPCRVPAVPLGKSFWFHIRSNSGSTAGIPCGGEKSGLAPESSLRFEAESAVLEVRPPPIIGFASIFGCLLHGEVVGMRIRSCATGDIPIVNLPLAFVKPTTTGRCGVIRANLVMQMFPRSEANFAVGNIRALPKEGPLLDHISLLYLDVAHVEKNVPLGRKVLFGEHHLSTWQGVSGFDGARERRINIIRAGKVDAGMREISVSPPRVK